MTRSKDSTKRVFSISGDKKGEELLVVCAWCGKELDRKPGLGQSGISHGICLKCQKKHFPKTVMKLKTIIFDIYQGKYKSLPALSRAMGVHQSHIYNVKRGKCRINETFIVGAIRAFPGYKLDDLFYVAPKGSENDSQE